MDSDQARIVNSSLWAAYADALGFMSELTDLTGLRRRIHADRVTTTIEWQRLVGGRFGAYVKLPAGCYSDDTQLRLATSRSINGLGRFDVEAFAKVELPVWLCFSLGGGSGTKAAATNLANSSATWFSNFYVGKGIDYLSSGGNGAAMRIQPHVWSAKRTADPNHYLADVVRNAVCTHGNLRAVVGAALHAILLARTFEARELPSPNVWKEALEHLSDLSNVVDNDRELSSFWLPVWEQRTGRTLYDALSAVLSECARDIGILEGLVGASPSEAYRSAVESVGALDRASRGSGTKTAILAAFLCWVYRSEAPDDALSTAANLLGSDTDTIATMAGAMMGAICSQAPEAPLLDRDYIEQEAVRLYSISICNAGVPSFAYPDLMRWTPPRNQTNAVSRSHGELSVAGLGTAIPIGESVQGQGREKSVWQWMRLGFGQTIVAKMRAPLHDVPDPGLPPANDANSAFSAHESRVRQANFFPPDDRTTPGLAPAPAKRMGTLDEMTSEAIKSGFDPSVIGRHVLQLSSLPDGIERCIAYVAIMGKARRSRLQRGG